MKDTPRLVVVALLALFAGYGVFEAWPLLAGPSISLAAPQNGAEVPGGIVTVSGTALRTASLTLDGGTLLRQGDGAFSETLALPRGASILTLTAADRFGRTTRLDRTVFVP